MSARLRSLPRSLAECQLCMQELEDDFELCGVFDRSCAPRNSCLRKSRLRTSAASKCSPREGARQEPTPLQKPDRCFPEKAQAPPRKEPGLRRLRRLGRPTAESRSEEGALPLPLPMPLPLQAGRGHHCAIFLSCQISTKIEDVSLLSRCRESKLGNGKYYD